LLTLLFVPVFYAVIEQLREGRRDRQAASAAHLKPTAPAE
jgi:hypothetical protein